MTGQSVLERPSCAVQRPDGSLLPVECALMHINTIFFFLHLLLIYLFKWCKFFVRVATSIVPLNCRNKH